MIKPSAPAVTMRRAISDPNLLGNVLPGDSWRAWRVLLIAMMGEPLTEEERPVFAKLTGRDHEPGARIEEFWGLIGRRGGKSRAISALLVFIAVFRPPQNLAQGERPVALCLAQNQKQAQIVLGYVAGVLDDTPLLNALIRNRTSDSLELSSGVVIEVRAASFRGLRGVTAIAVVCDEICFWYSSDGSSVNPDDQILAAVRPALATTGGPLIAISSPYARRGEAWETYRRHFGPNGDPLILVAQGASRDLNPDLPQKIIDRAYERDAASASAEYGAQFRSDIESYLSREIIDAAVVPGRYELPPVSGPRYFGFCDPSGGSADDMTMAVAHREGETLVLDCIRAVKPPFSPDSVVSEFADTLKSYGLHSVKGDRYGGGWPAERFSVHGIKYEPAEKPKSDIYRDAVPMFSAKRVELLDHPKLVAQLIGLERRTARGGRDSIDHPPSGHDDVANAVCGALTMITTARQPMVISPEFMERVHSLGRVRSF